MFGNITNRRFMGRRNWIFLELFKTNGTNRM